MDLMELKFKVAIVKALFAKKLINDEEMQKCIKIIKTQEKEKCKND